MRPVSGKVFCRALERAGWTLARITGSHHIYTRPGDPQSLAVPVHGNQDLAPGTQRRLMKQAGLRGDDI